MPLDGSNQAEFYITVCKLFAKCSLATTCLHVLKSTASTQSTYTGYRCPGHCFSANIIMSTSTPPPQRQQALMGVTRCQMPIMSYQGCEDWGLSRYMLSRVCHMFPPPASLRNWAPARRHRSYSGSRTEVMVQSMAISLFITQAITKYNKSLLLA